jgi:hypothetical protein
MKGGQKKAIYEAMMRCRILYLFLALRFVVTRRPIPSLALLATIPNCLTRTTPRHRVLGKMFLLGRTKVALLGLLDFDLILFEVQIRLTFDQ